MTKSTIPANTAALVDRLGVLKAEIAALEDILKPLGAQLKETGPGVYSGTLYDATVSQIDRETLAMDAVRAYFNRTPAGKRWLKAHTTTSSYLDLRVKARVQGRKAA